ncbi:MAG: hypothetical protein FWG87_12955 [Defluviitaleaceae bacterium]|nr:hypothetical protein [Defluviitaleaceae bacterium]
MDCGFPTNESAKSVQIRINPRYINHLLNHRLRGIADSCRGRIYPSRDYLVLR